LNVDEKEATEDEEGRGGFKGGATLVQGVSIGNPTFWEKNFIQNFLTE